MPGFRWCIAVVVRNRGHNCRACPLACRHGRPRVGHVPRDERLGRRVARRDVPRGARAAFVRPRAQPGPAAHALVLDKGRDAGHLLLHATGRSACGSRSDSRAGSGRSGTRRPTIVGPSLLAGGAPPRPRDGHISWSVDVVPAATADAAPAAGDRRDALWNHAREVDAAYVRAIGTDAAGHSKASGSGSSSIAASARRRCRSTVHASPTAGSLRTGTESAARRAASVRPRGVENGRGAPAYVPALAPGAH